jgi:hypothetical protein
MMPVMAAIRTPGDCIAGETTENGTAGNASDITMRDSAADHTSTDRTDHGAGRVTVSAAGICK